MVAHRRSIPWALSTALCAAALVAIAAAGRLVAVEQDSQAPPSPLVPPPKEKTPSPLKEGSGGSSSAPPSGGAGPLTQTTPQAPLPTNHTQLNQTPPLSPPHDGPPQSSPPLPGSNPGKLPQTSKVPPTTPAPLLLSPPPPSVPVSTSPPPTGKQEQPLTRPQTEAPPSENVGNRDGSGDGGDTKGGNSAGWTPVEYEKVDKCNGIHFKCSFLLDGCTMSFPNDHGGLLLYVRNIGEKSVNVTVLVPPSTEIDMQGLPKNGAGQVVAKNVTKIIIKTGEENCIPFSKDPSTSDLFKQFRSYTARMTPIYGAYAFFLTALIAGGTWACCSFARRRRRRDSGVPYQQLEMGGIQSQATVVADSTVDNTADGWEQGWDDDWDDEEAVSSRPQESGNPSTNGITSKPTNNGGWEDWDD